MNQKSASTNWKSHLPDVFLWTESVKISQTPKDPQNGSHYLLTIKDLKDKKNGFVLDAPLLSESVKADLCDQIRTMGYSASPDQVILKSGDASYLLVQQNSVDVSPLRKARQAGLDASRLVKNLQIKNLHIFDGASLSAAAIFEGLGQGLYQLNTFKEKASSPASGPGRPEAITLISTQKADPEDSRSLILGSCLSRFVADAPPNWLNPERFAEIASEMAQDQNISCTVRKRAELEKLGMGAYLSVGAGSVCEPHFIELNIKGQNPDKTIALIGKGLTFDAGGVSLKPAQGMEEMKYDMCGGAAVLGAAYVLSRHQPPFNVTCLIGAVENLIDNNATRPGDVITSMSGKTIEVLNTDAEGRLVLADLLYYARTKLKPEFMIDAATLTGSVLHALGSCGSGYMCNQKSISEYLKAVSEQSGDPLWELPLWPELAKEIRSDLADLKNIANPSVKAGSLMGGAFLREFVGDTPWAHVDIAGTGWNCKATGFPASGGSGYLLKTLVNVCLSFEGKLP